MLGYFKHFYNKYQIEEKPAFVGNNPYLNASENLQFDAIFESGNLDCAIKI